MRRLLRLAFAPAVAAALAFGVGGVATAADPGPISQTQTAGPYTVTLKVLPAESFGPHGEMTWDAGAKPEQKAGPAHPNHHVVAFVERDGKPVENANVEIAYEPMAPNSSWRAVPVARMHVSGKSLATTHYGNNVKLEPGSYQARVTVNGSDAATFEFQIPSS
jgi:hypothetical protein